MADTEYNAEEAAEIKKRRAFKKFSYVLPHLALFKHCAFENTR